MSAWVGTVRRWLPFAETLGEQSLRSMATKAYVGGVIATGAALLIQFAPLEYPRPWLAVGLLAAALILSAFKLRLPLGRGNSSMWAALQSVKDGEADAAISGGNTGALMAMATLCLARRGKSSAGGAAPLTLRLRRQEDR